MPALRLTFLLVTLLFTGSASAFYIIVHGVVTDHFTGDPMKGVQVKLVKDSIERETVSTNWNGRYEIHLERGYTYEVHYQRHGMVSKHVSIDATEIPLFPDVPFYEMDIQITMIEQLPDFDMSAFDVPVGKAIYKHSVRNLNWDREYTNARRTVLERLMINYEREQQVRRKAARAEALRSEKKKRKVANF
jgi:5-hydroxyisourate hydrolase-like protein (transthyretin family)